MNDFQPHYSLFIKYHSELPYRIWSYFHDLKEKVLLVCTEKENPLGKDLVTKSISEQVAKH